MTEPLLRLEAVTRRFGGTLAVDRVSLSITAGRITGLIGPNGAGKTTLLNLIAGALLPDEGALLLRGTPLPRRAHAVARAGVGRLFQEVRVFESLSVLENVLAAVPQQAGEGIGAALLAPRRVRRETAAATAEALDRLRFVGLADRATEPAGRLSYGQQKLLAIARLLATGADLLLLDEPASGVNPRLIEQLAELLRSLVAQGLTVLLVEHNMSLVREVAEELVLLADGRVVTTGPTQAVWASPELREVYLLPAE